MSTPGTPHTSSRRAALLEQLIVALTSPAGGVPGLPIRTRAPDDPTIALLDAWATVGDVLGFYLDRIAGEGYLTTATQPGSILTLASLVGYQPAPGLAAQVYLAYALGPDPADGAVTFSPGLLFQSVPGPGQQPQTFESAGALLARPSWNLLAPRSSQPLAASTTSLVVDSTTAALSPNDAIVLQVAGTSDPSTSTSTPQPSTPHAVFVASAAVDYSAQVTNVTLQSPAVAPPATHAKIEAAAASGPPPTTTDAIDNLLAHGLGKPTAPVPRSTHHLLQTAQSVFSDGSDAVPRLLATLQPALAPVLYAALGSTPVGSPAVTGASAMQVKAAPFGASAPPQPVFNARGRQGTRDWPIGNTFTLQLSVTATDFRRLLQTALEALHRPIPDWLARALPSEELTTAPLVDVQWSVAAFTSQATIDLSHQPPGAPAPPDFGGIELRWDDGVATLSYDGYTGDTAPATPPLRVSADFTATPDAVTLEFTDPDTGVSATVTWDPRLSTFSGQAGGRQLTVAWAISVPPAGEDILTITIATPLPLSAAAQKILRLDGNYPGITPGSYVVIDSADRGGSASGIKYPVIAQATLASTVAASGYGITAKVTQLTLDQPWIDGSAVLQSALRPLTVYAQAAPLALAPAPVTADVSGAAIDLDGLVAGVQPGRLIAVTGTRTDLPDGAAVPSGEIAMIASVATGGDGGDTPYSTLKLTKDLAYSYQRATVKVYGNVVAAHQGATISQVLGSGQPAQAPQSFTISSGPLLADPRGPGTAPSLTVTVDGVGYAPVARFDSTTPARSFLLGTNASGQATITFPAPLPAGTGNIMASYRAGDGSQGNVQGGQITQLLSRPASLASVTNPLPASGGSAGDDQESVRAAVPASLSGLGRVVTLNDYAALANSIAGVGQASAAGALGGGVVVTVAGPDPVQLDKDTGLCPEVTAAIAAVADPAVPVQVVPASLYLIALTAEVIHDPLVSWDKIVTGVQAALVARFGYGQQSLGQDVATSDLLAAAHTVPGVRSVTVTGLALVPAGVSATDLSAKLPALLVSPVPLVAPLAAVPSQWGLPPAAPAAAAITYVDGAALGTLILSEQSP